ncbi:outer membrane protein [Helicobacter baculiformis]|uniref:Outer membrane protein n=1 Tax=Helicobacter baculiformis TaxID=427351 RepID=A0ABV7ZFW3_9HELI|nr:outer membrane protein [Helicobacter baculiformis]
MLATSRKILSAGIFTLLGLAPLSAERNGVYVSVGFEYSNMQGTYNVNRPESTSYATQNGIKMELITPALKENDHYSGNLFGADIQAGYKQFFGKKKHFGVRYYGILSAQGGGYYGQLSPVTKGSLSNVFYGVGVDALYNFYEKKHYTFGVFGSVMLGGSAWGLGAGYTNGQCTTRTSQNICQSMNKKFSALASDINQNGGTASSTANYVQFAFNFGLRANLSRHNGLELGIRVPVINDPFFKSHTKNNTDVNFSLRRVIAFL